MAVLYLILADCVLGLHLAFILWVILGPLLTRRRATLTGLHIACLVWGIVVDLTAWPCPLTLLENWLELRAGVAGYQGGFLLHYLDKLVYPDVSPTLLTIAGVSVCAVNLAIYARRVILWRTLFCGQGER